MPSTGRSDRFLLHAIRCPVDRLLDHGEFGERLRQVVECLLLQLQGQLAHLQIRFAHGSLEPCNQFLADLQLPAELGLLGLRPNKLGLSYEAALGHRRDQIELPGGYLETLAEPHQIGLGFPEFILPLCQARLQDKQLVLEIVAAGEQQFLFVVAYLGRRLSNFLRACQRNVQPTSLFLLQPSHADLQGSRFGFQFAERRCIGGVFEAKDQIARAYRLPDLDSDLLHDAGFACLDDLSFRCGDDAAVSARDFVHLGESRPGNERSQQCADQEDDCAGRTRRAVDYSFHWRSPKLMQPVQSSEPASSSPRLPRWILRAPGALVPWDHQLSADLAR